MGSRPSREPAEVSRSRAVLRLVRRGGVTRIAAMRAETPQRLSVGSPSDWLVAYHQLLGDGFFPGESLTLAVEAGPGTRTVLRSATASPARCGKPSLAATRLLVGPGATLVYVPGALLPHAGAVHGASLAVRVAPGGSCIVAHVILPGRTAHEQGRYRYLRLRTRAAVAGELALAEDLSMGPDDWPTGAGALLTVLALGDTPAARPEWWDRAALGPLAVSPLRTGGCAARGLFSTISEAADLTAALTASIMRAS